MVVLAYLLSFLTAALSALLFYRIRSPTSIVLWIPKAMAGSAVAFVALMGALGAALGVRLRAPLATAAGALGSLLSLRYVLRVTARHDGFERAFGAGWQRQIPSERQARMLQRRWMGRLPSPSGVCWKRDVAFWTIPPSIPLASLGTDGADRELLCDIWQPPQGVSPSGLAFIYFHGGGWHWMDKDFGTRPFFRHLSAQGHVVMDVAYRLCPEVDIFGMVGDAKRAIAWVKANAENYGVDPARVVLAGGSAGGHLALLAAYAPDHPALTPADVRGADVSVRAVVGYYAVSDMRAVYHHFDATFGSLGKAAELDKRGMLYKITGAMSGWVMGSSAEKAEGQDLSFTQEIGEIGLFPWIMKDLLGGSPDEVPQVYELASPITHAGADSPPTLLLQGEHDSFQPANISRALHRKLVAAGVPSVYVEFPQTEHGFDMGLPRYAPAAQAALYDVDRFLALMVQD